jgi:Tol biopolymer transport system component
MEEPNAVAPPPSEGRLESWKEIASYLNRDVRTVQRWERSKHLPIRRLPGGDVSRVYALKSELDAWWGSRGIHILSEPEGPPPALPAARRRPIALWVGGVLAAAAVAVLALRLLSVNRRLPEPRVSAVTSYAGEVLYPSFSADGRQMVFTWNGEKQDNYDLYIKLLGGGEPMRITRDPAVDTMASWSPDGTQIAFCRWRSNSATVQFLVVPAMGGAERLLGEASLTEIWPVPLSTWTPDGRGLIVGWPESPNRTSLYLLSLESGERKRLTAPPAGWWGDDSPVLSPDGTQLAFIRRQGPDQGNVHLLRLTHDFEAAEEPQAVSHEACCAGNPLWTGHGREILYVKREADIATLHRISARPGAQPQTVGMVGTLGTHISLSPHGDKLAYVSGEVNSDLWRVDLPPLAKHTGPRSDSLLNAERMYSSSRVDAMPDFSPDGRRVAFCSNRSGGMEIWIADADGTHTRQLTSLDGPAAHLPRWSPDGKQVVYYASLEGRRDIYVIGAEGGKARALTRNAGTNFLANWSRDGRWIYFASDRHGDFQSWKAPSAGGNAVQVTRQGGYGGIESADGRTLYYAKTQFAGAIWQVPVNGGEEKPVHPAVRCYRVAWNFAVTGAGIYSLGSENALSGFRVQLYEPATHRLQILGRVTQSLGRSMAVSPDDRWLLFSDYPARRGDLMLVEDFR